MYKKLFTKVLSKTYNHDMNKNKTPHLHEIVGPLREIVRNVGEFVVDRVVPTAVIENLFTPPEARGAEAMLSRELDREGE